MTRYYWCERRRASATCGALRDPLGPTTEFTLRVLKNFLASSGYFLSFPCGPELLTAKARRTPARTRRKQGRQNKRRRLYNAQSARTITVMTAFLNGENECAFAPGSFC